MVAYLMEAALAQVVGALPQGEVGAYNVDHPCKRKVYDK